MRRSLSSSSSSLALLALPVLLAACSSGDSEKDSTHGDSAPPPVCNAGTAWTKGHQAFRDATAEWGLDVLNPAGTRILAVDYDDDGWPDLEVRVATDAADDFSTAKGARYHWLLHNNGAGGFEDLTQSSGVVLPRLTLDPEAGRAGQVWAFGDVDNDGDLDLFSALNDTTASQDETSEIMLSNGDGTFSLGPEVSDLRHGGSSSPASAAFVDYDHDGILDLWVPEYDVAQDRLYRGDQTGAFEEVTYDVGLRTEPWSDLDDVNNGLAHSVAWSGLACDLNNDGYQELMASSYGRAPSLLWQADGDGTFTNTAVVSGYAYDDRMDWSDNESARCYCHLYPETKVCKGIPAPTTRCESDADNIRGWDPAYDTQPYRLGGNNGTTVCADINNDGWMDLMTTDIVHWDVGASSDPSELLMNTHSSDVTFERPGNEATGLVRDHRGSSWDDGDMTGAIFDFDNDGWPDPFIGSSDYPDTHALLWHNDGDGTVSEVPIENGIDHHRSHGVGVADFDRDGDLDIVLGHSSARCEGDCYDTFNVRFFENVTGQDEAAVGNFIQLRLEGTGGSNRAAIGARVEVTTPDGVTQTQEVGGGHGHYGIQHDLALHFGLGASCEAEVTVRWPDADQTSETFTLGGGYRYHVVEGGEPEVEPAP
jgi:enediyne biosynthesis protein E4